MVAAVRSVGDLEFVNGGGTGSIATTVAEPAVTEVAAGSGFYAPMLFQYYRTLSLAPAAGYVLPVSRSRRLGSPPRSVGGTSPRVLRGRTACRCPISRRLRLDPLEGAGEAQTPLLGPAAAGLRVGDRVYLRHARQASSASASTPCI